MELSASFCVILPLDRTNLAQQRTKSKLNINFIKIKCCRNWACFNSTQAANITMSFPDPTCLLVNAKTFNTHPHRLSLWTPCFKPRHACAIKPEVLKSWSLEIDYSRAPWLCSDQKTRGLRERQCEHYNLKELARDVAQPSAWNKSLQSVCIRRLELATYSVEI